MSSRRAPLLCVTSLLAACATDPDQGPPEPESPAVEAVAAVTLSPRRELARHVEDHLVSYGTWDEAELAIARQHDLVVLYPNVPGLTRAQVASIQAGSGGGDRVLVACYLSIGEDLRTASLTDAELRADPRFRGDGTGPRVDPRGPLANGGSLAGIDPRGLPSPGGTGFASYYLDDVSVRNDPAHVGDGFPDRNGNFHGAFVNAGDPAWFAALQDMTYDGPDHIAGLRELLTTSHGRGLGCDGVFLDTLDTAAPNAWTDASSSNQTEFEWTAGGFAAFVTRLRAAYPDIVIVQNRGLFFFNPALPQYQLIPRGQLDFVTFESYRLNSGVTDNPDPYHYPNNRYNYAPRLMAEANRSDGFRVVSIGYAEGPPDQMSSRTLVGGSTLGLDSLLEDIRVTERLAGFRHYLTNARVDLINRFVLDHADRSDTAPPVWTSTYNDRSSWPATPVAPTPRVGLQEVVPGPGSLTVRWDVALDLDRVRYALYYQPAPFDFVADPGLTRATRVVLDGRPPATYALGVGPGVYAHEATVEGLVPGQRYYLLVRAFDDSPAANQDDNQVVLTGVPSGAPSYLGRLRASNGVTSLTYRAVHAGSWSYRRVYVDRDRVVGSGWQAYGIGADLLLENGRLFRYTGDGTRWDWTFVRTIGFTSASVDGLTAARWDLAQADVGAAGGRTDLVFQVQRTGETLTSAIYPHVYTTTDPASPYLGWYVENDASQVYFHADVSAPFAFRHVFVDDDGDPATGYRFAGVGAGYLIENGSLYRYLGPDWRWTWIASAREVVSGDAHDWTVARSDLGLAAGTPRITVVYQANGGAPTFVAPGYAHPFTR